MSDNIMTNRMSEISSHTSASQASQTTQVRAVDPKDSEHFRDKLNHKHEEDEAALPNTPSFVPTEPTLVNNIHLAQSALPALAESGKPAETMRVNTITRLQEIVDVVVEKMAISTNKENNQEIRILLKEHILSNTEIRINASNHQLIVHFITSSSNANQLLNEQLFEIQSKLKSTLNRPVDLSVQFTLQNQDPLRNQDRASAQERRYS